MFARLLESLRVRSNDRIAGATASVDPPGPAQQTARPMATTPPTVAHTTAALPHPSAMIDGWRQQVARAAIALRSTYCTGPARTHAERLLLRLAVDQEMVVRQPPPAAQEALAVATDPACELSRLVHIVERDPTLTRGLMRHASSALLGAGRPPASIDDAVSRLGATGVQVAVLAGMAEGLLAHGRGPYSPLAQRTWASMVRVAPIARDLARAVGVPPDEAFLLGLLHDVGTLVLFDLAAALQTEVPNAGDVPTSVFADAVRELHEPLGGITLLRWGVDPRAAWAVAHHHRRQAPAEPDRRSEVIFLATCVDDAIAAQESPALDAWFAEGQLSASRDRVATAVARIRGTT